MLYGGNFPYLRPQDVIYRPGFSILFVFVVCFFQSMHFFLSINFLKLSISFLSISLFFKENLAAGGAHPET